MESLWQILSAWKVNIVDIFLIKIVKFIMFSEQKDQEKLFSKSKRNGQHAEVKMPCNMADVDTMLGHISLPFNF